MVWFTDSIPQSFGPFTYFGFPGLVLEVYDQVRTRHLVATKIETGPYRVVLPQKGIIISSENFYKLKR
jgi:GLPGLI family protein